ncbi:AAA family ATPase [Paenibacillus senegalensis]|uniref:AAA family ATPase n=1 Tax=Paenibacillus senegalensis TaxID=1465766 RepID=UPI000288D237|nr:MoxR family ATPase [Paenibacillus senegalensis]
MDFTEMRALANRIKENVGKVIVGKEDVVDLLLVAVISSGHVLLEDVPGTGKTLLAKAMAKSLGCSFKRVQFTPDLLPTDLSGIYFYNQKNGEFEFRAGPIFSQIVLADEINRATPRTQSSLLECMEERQITVDGITQRLERPFLVLATQNPVENQGTFPLPEAQLDRFLIKIGMGYPSSGESVAILKRFKGGNPLDTITAVASADDIIAAQNLYSETRVDDDLLRYIVELVEKTRSHHEVAMGVSPRGSQSLLKAAQVYAVLQGRDYVIPDDIKAMAVPVLAHRLVPKGNLRYKERWSEQVIEKLLNDIPVPTEAQLAQRQE